jgi:hypothetical protein
MLHRVVLVRTDVSEELSASFISVRRVLVTASVVPRLPILANLMKEALSSSETSVLTRATRRNIPEDATLHSHRRENLKSYMPHISNQRFEKYYLNAIINLVTGLRFSSRREMIHYCDMFRTGWSICQS